MRNFIVFLLSLAFVMNGYAQTAPVCSSVHASAQFNNRVQFSNDESLEISEINLFPKELSSDPDKALEDLIFMTGQTTKMEIVPKDTLNKGELTLVLMLERGYLLELQYGSHSPSTPAFMLERLDLVSPTGNRKTLTKEALDFHELRLQKDHFTLEKVYPSGSRIDARIPLKISGPVLEQYRKFLPRLTLFSKEEIRRLTLTHDLKKMKWVAQGRALKQFLKELIGKLGMKRTIEWAVILTVAAHFGGGFSLMKDSTRHAVPTETQRWAGEMSLGLGLTLGKETQSEVIALNKEIASQLTDSKAGKISPDLSRPGIKIGDTDYVWLVEKKETNRTYIVFSRDKAEGSLEYFSVEINPQQYPHLVEALKKNGMKLSLQ